jgi:hypothetical protein
MAAVAVLAALAVVGAQGASAADLQPIDLRADGGEESWHASPAFTLRWTNPPGAVAAVHYRVLDPSGQVAVGETTLGWAATSIEHLGVPAFPGAYTAEVWLEDAGGTEGTPAIAKLRFDDAAPGQLEPPPVAAWIGRAAFPYTLHLGHPVGPLPLSGIAGYAVSVDGIAEGSPCAVAAPCGAMEIELHGGIAADALTIAGLPEGASYLHAVAISGSGTRSALTATTALHVDETDPVTQLAGEESGWSNRPLKLTASATDQASGMVGTEGGATPFTAIRIDGGVPVTAAGDSVATTLIASGIHTVAYYARDGAGNIADGGVSNGWPNHAPAIAVVKIDREGPRLAFASGQDPLDPERIEARASDALSGLDPDRGSIAVRPVGSGGRFAGLPTERSGTLLRARWDSEDYPLGEYEFRATAYDLAGNSASTLSRGDGSAMRLPSPLKVGTTLIANLRSRTLPYGRGASFSGRLIAGRRAPLAGIPVQVIERFDAGALPRELVTTVRSGASGAFAVHLNSGPSREVLAVAPATATTRGTSSKPLRLAVRGGVRLRVSSPVARVGGHPVIFSGKVSGDGAPIPTDGKAVQLQFRLPGLAWSEFRTVHTDARGHFHYAYRFADDDSRGVRFQFRAFAPAQAGWPFEPAGSPPVAVRGL